MGCPRASWLHPRRSWHFAVWTRRSRSRQNNRYYTRIRGVFPEKPRLPAQLHNSPAQIDSWWQRNESGLSDTREWIFGRITNESGFSPTFNPDTGQKWEIIRSRCDLPYFWRGSTRLRITATSAATAIEEPPKTVPTQAGKPAPASPPAVRSIPVPKAIDRPISVVSR